MMKAYKYKPPGLIKPATLAVIGFVITMVLMQGSALASTASNTVITNTATVNYDDSVGTPQGAVIASVDVTVNLVEATPTLDSPADQSLFSGSNADYTYTITSNANGVDLYNLTYTQNAIGANITVVSSIFRDSGDTSTITQIELGGTSVRTATAISDVANTAIDVAYDGTADNVANGIAAGDVVVINGQVHSVVSVAEDNGLSTATITIAFNGTAHAAAVNDNMYEQAQFIARLNFTTTVSGQTADYNINARDDASAQGAATDQVITTVLLAPNLTVSKYVRNVSCATCNPTGGTGTTINGQEYWDTASGETVTGNPGNTLEYVIAVANGGSAGTATDVIISDPVPEFTTYVAASMGVDPDGVSGWTALNDGANDAADPGEFDSGAGSDGTVYIYAGTGGDDGTVAATYNDGTGGSLTAGTTTYGLFQVTID